MTAPRPPRFTLTETAASDLDEIWDFIAKDSVDTADRIFEELLEACDELGGMPGMGHYREDLSSGRPLRFWPVYSYLIVYREDRVPIEVLAVVRGTRDLEALLKER